MNLKDCYIKFGGDFDEVLGRLRREQTVQKFVYKFLDDKSFSLFEASMGNKDYAEALRAVHTLKGICQNLSFDRLYEVSHELTELLRDRTGEQPGIPEAMEKVTEVYEMTIEEIKKGL